MTRQCFLRCLLDSHSPIRLPHNVETIVGRSRITKIKDPSCSRQQCKFFVASLLLVSLGWFLQDLCSPKALRPLIDLLQAPRPSKGSSG